MNVPCSNIQISVVIPTYNRGRLVKRAVESVLVQTKRPFEIIVVDDGSTDNTRQKIEAFSEKVTYVFQQNQGSAAARNNGMRRAQSEWIALLDSDDIWFANHLEKMAEAIEATNGEAFFYFADTIRPLEKGSGSRWEGVDFTIHNHDCELNPVAAEWVLYRPQPMMLQSTVFKKSAYINAGGFLSTLRYRDDTHLFLKLGLDGPVCAVANVGTQMTSDDDPSNRLTISYDNQLKGAKMQVIMFEDLLNTMPNLPEPIRKELKERLAYAHLSMARHTWKCNQLFQTIYELLNCFKTYPPVLSESIQRNLRRMFPFKVHSK